MELIKNETYKIENLRYNYGHYIVPDYVKGGIAVDIGSNNGCFIDKYKDFFNKIHAYEANYFLVEKLKEKYLEFDNIEINHNAVSEKSDEILKLIKYKCSDDDGSFAILKSYTKDLWDESEIICEVKSINIEQILEKCFNKIDFLKVDCETSEYELLFNKDLSNIQCIAIELHNQLGIEKYTELYNFLLKTHKCDNACNFAENQHQELLFYK